MGRSHSPEANVQKSSGKKPPADPGLRWQHHFDCQYYFDCLHYFCGPHYFWRPTLLARPTLHRAYGSGGATFVERAPALGGSTSTPASGRRGRTTASPPRSAATLAWTSWYFPFSTPPRHRRRHFQLRGYGRAGTQNDRLSHIGDAEIEPV